MVRTAHLERAHEFSPASIVYREKRYDYDPALEAGLDIVRAGDVRAALLLARSGVETLEVNEPLMISAAARSALAIAAVRVAGTLRRRRTSVVSYAIENLYPPVPASLKGRIGRRARLVLARFVHANLDRLAFGTDASRELYRRAFGSGGATTTTIPALPSAVHQDTTRGRPSLAVFLGAFDERKGLPLLLDAWPLVRERRADARLLLMGKGPLESLAREAAATDTSIELLVDPPRDTISDALAGAKVLVLPSQRRPRWREQVGLPIVEGLAAGCVVVTTSETGLADWLTDEGHFVIPADADAATLAAAVSGALGDGRAPADLLAALPSTDGRRAADDWLFGRRIAPHESMATA
ncbi:glycosyltransferase family 4 protein [Leifsonia sp. NPDC077715]|uniref:glycosyltransferase family 4 protein n=1 Tax=Leifsonia sp. NPDC077715 TaxID=3155539 RepID=UPI003427306E